MEKGELFKNLNECYRYGDQKGLLENIQQYQKETSLEEASRDFAEYIYLNFTSYKADAMAGLLQLIIRDNPKLALLKFPQNFLYRMIIIKGSMDLYQCFIEEAVEPFLKDKDEDSQFDYYTDLYATAISLDDYIFPSYAACVKGIDFNGAFSTNEENSAVSFIHTEDFNTMDNVVEKYNAIICRRDIIADLDKRS